MKYRVHDPLLSYIFYVWNYFVVRSLYNEVSVLVIPWGAQDSRFRQVSNEWVCGGPHAPYSNSSLVIWKPSPPYLTTLPPTLSTSPLPCYATESSSWRSRWFRTGSGRRRNAEIFRKNDLGRPLLGFPFFIAICKWGIGPGYRGSHKWDCMDICQRREEEFTTQ